MKSLKFSDRLPELIMRGDKTTTWRLNDEKNITVGDTLSLCYKSTGAEFAQAKVISVKEIRFRELTDLDKDGHEKFKSDSEMYEHYSTFYKTVVTPDTILKVIKFKLISSTER